MHGYSDAGKCGNLAKTVITVNLKYAQNCHDIDYIY